MRNRLLLSLILTLLTLFIMSCGGSSGPSSNGGGGGGGGGNSSVSTVAIVVLENTSYEHVIGSGSMPFLNSLVPQGALATQYFGNVHPSIGNYFMLTTGQLINTDDNFTGDVPDDNIARRLTAAGKTWKGYFQSLPSTGYTGTDRYPYIKHHNPFSYFTDVSKGPGQAPDIVSLTQLSADETAGAFPNFMLIVPDNEHNAHDCPGGATAVCALTDKLGAADAFLHDNVPPLLNNTAFKQNGLLLITFDEGDQSDSQNGGGHVVMLALGSHAKPGFQSSGMYQHQNTLRTVSDLLGLTPLGAAANATSMSDLLQ